MGFIKWLYHLNDAPKEIRHLHWKQRWDIMEECRRRVHPDGKGNNAADQAVRVVLLIIPLSIFAGLEAGIWGGILTAVVLIAISAVFLLRLYARQNREPDMQTALKKILAEQNIRPGYCLGCGYDLRGTAGGQCPECGAEIPAGESEDEHNADN